MVLIYNGKNIEKFNVGGLNIPNEIAKHLYKNKAGHCVFLYILLSRNKIFSGLLTRRKIKLVAYMLGQSHLTTIRQLNKLSDLGIISQKHKNIWMVCGGNSFASTAARSRCKLLLLPSNMESRLDASAFLYSVFDTEQFEKLQYENKRSRKNKSQDYDDEMTKGVYISHSYSQQFLSLVHGVNHSTQYISRLRKRANQKGYIDTTRQIEGVKMTKVDKETGEVQVLPLPSSLWKAAIEKDSSCRIVTNSNGSFLIKEKPLLFTKVLTTKSRGISNAQKEHARYLYSLTGR